MKRVLTSLLLMMLALAVAPSAFAQQLMEYAKFQGPKGGIAVLAISPDGRTLAIAGKDKTITLWDVNTGKMLNNLGGYDAAVVSLTFSADGKRLAARNHDNMVKLWNVPAGTELAARGSQGKKGEPFIGGKLEPGLLALGADGKATVAYVVVDTSTGKQQRIAAARDAVLAFSTDGKTLAVSDVQRIAIMGGPNGEPILGTAHIINHWDVATGKLRAMEQGVAGTVAMLADGQTIVAVDAQHAVTVWIKHRGWGCLTPEKNQELFKTIKQLSPERLKGLKDALADLEKGILKVRTLPPEIGLIQSPPWRAVWVKLVKKECGVDLVDENILPIREEAAGYNGLMMMEIEHRFGKGILEKLSERAQAEDKAGQPTTKPEKQEDKVTERTKNETDESKASRGRIAGMKAALADIEKGFLKLKTIPPPASAWYPDYVKLLKNECGIDTVYVTDEVVSPLAQGEMEGYNALMLLEIEHRYGRGILGTLGKRAMDDYFKAKQGGK